VFVSGSGPFNKRVWNKLVCLWVRLRALALIQYSRAYTPMANIIVTIVTKKLNEITYI
jgi:hypothetical protein